MPTRTPSVRSYSPVSTRHHQPPRRRGRWLAAAIFAVAAFSLVHVSTSNAAANIPEIHSGIAKECVDAYHSGTSAGTAVDVWNCNDSKAQTWTVNRFAIEHAANMCLSVQNDSKQANSVIVLESCSGAPGQVWLRDQSGFYNPNSGLCLSAPIKQKQGPLQLASCNSLSQAREQWVPNGAAITTSCQQGSKGEKIACIAAREWTTWQSGTPDHETLLTRYTGNTPYEAWCADFVSYVYREAGYPFKNALAGWNENNANSIQYYGFTKHDPSDYTPQPGDVAYFDYEGGHVEIVVSGGTHPTFIYGNSATIDPTTGNGQMQANTIIDDGSMGQLVYYLSPHN